jgi:hypothetical protein
MRLDYCPTCGHYLETPIVGPKDWSAEAIARWQQEIAETCAHTPVCGGPWEHAVKAIREAHAHGEKQKRDRTGASPI